jgi:integrase
MRHTAGISEVAMGTIQLQPAEQVLDACNLEALIELWLEDCAVKRPPATVAGYYYKILYWSQWWQAQGAALDWRLRRRDVERFARELDVVTSQRTGETLSYNTRRDVLRRLRQMFHWAYLANHTGDCDYSHWVPALEGAAPKRKPASLEHLRRLFDAASSSPDRLRDQAILALLIGTGIRRGECASLTVDLTQIHADGSGVAVVAGKRTRANADGVREVAFDPVTGAYLRAYLDTYGLRSGPLWQSQYGKALGVVAIYRVVKRCIKRAGLEEALQGCHDLRRAFATHYSRLHQGQDHADLLRRQMGHANYRQTTEYNLMDAEDIRGRLVSPMSLIQRRGQ